MNAAAHIVADWSVIVTLPEATFREARDSPMYWMPVSTQGIHDHPHRQQAQTSKRL